ncbi:MAG: pyruvoyl-dependent arginine decarboxylase [Candidatus Berkelbacteria bacterium]
MKICITKGQGTGNTELSAFDEALHKAGIANYNLIRLSSVIPVGSEVDFCQLTGNGKDEFGYKLYVVYAQQRESVPGKEAWAGIGWVQAEDGRGLFVEHEGSSESEVHDLIQNSLTDMVKYRSDSFGLIQYAIVGTKCEDKPVCAFIAAVYQSESWEKGE